MTTAIANKPNNAIQTRESNPAAGSMKQLLESKVEALRAVATKHLTPEKLIRILGLAMSRQPKLMQCTPMSVLNCAMTFGELGLVPSSLGTAYMVPFWNSKSSILEAIPIIGYRGLITLARRSGDIGDISVDVVREGDVFEWEKGLNPKLRHVPKAPLEAPITHAWCVAKFRSGGHQIEIMRIEEIEKIRKFSKARDQGPWVTDYAEMAKKTVIRRAAKLWPLTPEVEESLTKVDGTEFTFSALGGDAMTDSAEQPVAPSNLDAAKAAVTGSAAQPSKQTAPVATTATEKPKPKDEPPVSDQKDADEFLNSLEGGGEKAAEKAEAKPSGRKSGTKSGRLQDQNELLQ